MIFFGLKCDDTVSKNHICAKYELGRVFKQVESFLTNV
jgi:hypothetical protein